MPPQDANPTPSFGGFGLRQKAAALQEPQPCLALQPGLRPLMRFVLEERHRPLSQFAQLRVAETTISRVDGRATAAQGCLDGPERVNGPESGYIVTAAAYTSLAFPLSASIRGEGAKRGAWRAA